MVKALADELGLSEEDRNSVYSHSGTPVFNGGVRWAIVYLTQAGLLERVGRGRFRITHRGSGVLASDPPILNIKYLEQFAEFRDFKSRSRSKEAEEENQSPIGQPPQEIIEAAYQTWRSGLARQLLQTVHAVSPKFFEQLVVDLLVAMGYCGSRKDAGKVVGKSGDEGVDGVINEDKLGLDVVYIQAKRWQGPVSRKEVQAFSGALDGQRASKGVMITTSRFTEDAIEFAERSTRKVVLFDGSRLAELMIDHGIGVSDKDKPTYVLKDIDTDYFEEA